jgi:hypothetical protein
MTLNSTARVILFGLALVLVGRTDDQQSQQTAMNVAMCALAIRSGLLTRQSGLQLSQLGATGLEFQRKAEAGRVPSDDVPHHKLSIAQTTF